MSLSRVFEKARKVFSLSSLTFPVLIARHAKPSPAGSYKDSQLLHVEK